MWCKLTNPIRPSRRVKASDEMLGNETKPGSGLGPRVDDRSGAASHFMRVCLSRGDVAKEPPDRLHAIECFETEIVDSRSDDSLPSHVYGGCCYFHSYSDSAGTPATSAAPESAHTVRPVLIKYVYIASLSSLKE
eukprot:GHVU01093287.1.p1 GENE.GHVU01093287.1~~GHVU01093287.1.p1  ORF type:complete len:135 (+),score=4.41 GHVU01093287.1:81-485(+)